MTLSISLKQIPFKFILGVSLLLIGSVIFFQINPLGKLHAGMFNAQLLQATRIAPPTNQTEFPKVLIDAIGERYTLASPPQHIASVTLATDEMLAQLVDRERIAGVTYFADDKAVSNVIDHYPASLTRLYGDVEGILQLQPDLVFIAAYTQANTVRTLLSAGIPVARLSTYRSFADLEHNIRLVAELTGTSATAEAILAEKQKQLEMIREKVKHRGTPRVLYYDLSGFTAGPGSLMDETIQLAGGHNVVADIGLSGSDKISEELAISLEPDVILLGGMLNGLGKTPVQLLRQRPGWSTLQALQKGRVYAIEGPWVLSVSQYRWDGIEAVARLIHPEAFL